MRGKTLEDYLDSPDGAGKVLAHARRLLQLERLYRDIAPAHLSGMSRLANYQSGTVLIHAGNGAAAAKLRQLTPTLIDGFARRGVDCHGVKIRVRGSAVEPGNALPRRKTLKPLSAQAFRALGGLRDALPDSELRQALDRLIRRSPVSPAG
ncbi:MAG: DUF721 domain-containing protein [Candidatus Accumulibacter sp.]|nr:DUF721 domain-containing protein [Accumulibacter sp.]